MSTADLTALAPTIDCLLKTASATAAASLAAAQAAAASLLEQAHTDAEAILAQARADGKAAAEHAAGTAITAARRRGRERILASQRRAYETLNDGIREALRNQAASPAGLALFAKLSGLAQGRLGPAAVVTQLQDGRIGVKATDGKRSLEVVADRYVQRELATLGDGIEALWK